MTQRQTRTAQAPSIRRRSSVSRHWCAYPRAARWPAPARAPVRGRAHSGRIPASLLRSFRGAGEAVSAFAVPVPLLLERVDDFLRHIGLVVLVAHAVSVTTLAGLHYSLGTHTLPF